MNIKSVHVTIQGRVQGVWYRGWTVDQAQALGLSGWVRNLSNGDVEAVFSGDEQAVEKMLNHCWQGPKLARVDAVKATDTESINERKFTQKPTE